MADFILDIDTKFLDRLEKAEDALEDLVKTTNKLSSTFESLIDGNLSRFSSAIDGISDKILDLSSVKIGDLGMKELETQATTSAAKIVDSVVEVSEAISKAPHPTSESGGMYEQLLDTLDGYIHKLDAAKERVRELSLEHVKSLKGTNPATPTGGFREGFGAEMQEATIEVDSLMQKISELSKFISGIQGISDESFGYMIQHVHDTSIELINLNDHLREQENISAENAKKNQQARDNATAAKKEWEDRLKVWEEGFAKEEEIERKRIEQQNLAAKKSSEAWKQAYEDRLLLYRKLFDIEEQKEKELAAQQAAKIRSKYKELLAAQRSLEKAISLADSYSSEPGESEHKQSVDYLIAEKNAVVKKRLDIERDYYNAVADLVKENEIERTKTELSEGIKRDTAYKTKKEANAMELAREYERAEAGYAQIERLEESHYEKMRAWREKNISEQSREDLYADEIKAYEDQVKAKAKADEDFAKREDARIKERDAALDAAAKAADKRDEEILKENEAFVEKIRTKYADLIRETRQVSQELTRIEGLEGKYGGDIDVSTQKSAYTTRLAQLNQERLEIERDHQDKISSIQAEETKRRMRDEVDVAERAARQAIEARKDVTKREEAYRNTFRGAMGYSRETKSIQEQIQAIKYLKTARENLNRTDFTSEKEYRKAINEVTLEIDRQADSIKDLKQEQERVPEISGQLKTAITNVVGIGAIKGYVNQLVRIRGEFELQNKSLQVLLRNKDEANRLWEQTVDLAVKSPYRVDQLVTATKQLAAYRIETEKLHSTTRMLADLSSGLGVEIDRLILAFGQVKAANFLRGTELRQFSEAGINILDELAEHYSLLEGRIVSVGDVFDRVSKRMVSFADVEAVLQNMTSEGGQFYKMQEQQAETLRGMTMNLKDSIMLMYNDIGETTDGILKKTLTFFKHVVDNWRSYANIITTVVGALAGYKTIITLSRILTAKWNPIAYIAASAFVKMGSTATWATARIRTLNRVISAIKLHPIMAIIAAIPALAGAIVGLNVSFDKNTDSVKSHSQILEENSMIAKRAASGIKELTEERSNLLKIQNRSVEQEKRLNDITSARTRLLGELATANGEYAKSLKLAGDNSEEMAKAIEEQNNKLDAQTVLAYKISNIDWGDRAKVKNAETTKVATSSVFGGIYDGNLDLGTMLTDSPTAIIENAINNSEGDIEKAISSMFSNLTGYARAEQIKMIKGVLEGTPYGDIISDYIDAENILSGAFSSMEGDVADVVTAFANTTRGKILKVSLNSADEAIKNNALLELQNYFKKEFVSQAIPDTAQEEFKRRVAELFGLEDDWFSKQISKELSAWQKGYNALLDALTKDRKIPSLTPVNATTSIKDQVTLLKEFKEEQEAIIKQYEDQQKYKVMLPIHSKEDADNAKKNLDVVQQLLEALGQIAKSDKADTRYTNLIKTVNDVYSAFDKLEEKFGDTIATEMLWRDYSESIDTAFKSVGKSANWVREQFGDLTSKESLKSALDWIAENASTKEARLQAKTASAKISVDIEIEERDKAFDKLNKQVEEMFAGYELSIELDKLQVPKEFAKEFFNIDSIDISELRSKVVGMKSKFDDKGTEGTKAYEEFLRKLDEMETKSQQERLKKYLQYTRNAIGERGKILMEETMQLSEIAKTFQLTDTFAISKGLVNKEQLDAIQKLGYTISSLMELSDEEILARNLGITAEQLSSLREYVELLKDREAIAIEGVKRETRQKLDKFDFEQFKGSEVFQELYSDLSNAPTAALDALIKKLDTHSDQWNKLPIDQVKEYTKLLKDASEALNSNKMPRELLAAQRAIIRESQYDNIGDASKAMVEAETRIEQLEKEKSIVENIANMRAQGIIDDEIKATLQEDQFYLMDKTLDTINEEVSSQEDQIKGAQKFLDAIKLITEAYKKQIENVNKVKTVVDKVFDGWDSINGLFEDGSMSAELLEIFQTLSDAGFEMRGMVSETRSAITNLKAAEEGATKFGFALDTASGIIGIIVAAVKVVVGLFQYFSERKNSQINADIEANMRDVEKLQQAYEDLERQIDDAFTSDSISSLTKDLNKNLEAQKREIEDNISLEEDKKDKDKDQEKIDEWNRELDDIERQQAENIEKMFSTLTDGVLDNVLDATRGFVDAWYDAYDETGDGMKGLENNFKEMFANILKQQASLTLISPFIDDFKGQLEGYMNDSRLTADEATALRAKWEEIAPQMNDALEQYFDSFSNVLDNDYGELSDLEKGIQGMTEDQAEVLAAYWNSCRFILANIDSTLTNLASSVLGGGGTTNPIVDAITTQTKVVEQIRDLIGSIITSGGSSAHQLSYLRVNDA